MNGYEREMVSFFAMLFGGPPEDENGTHKHECPDCGAIWEHPNARSGDADAHVCPSCKVQMPTPWFRYDGEAPPTHKEGKNGKQRKVRKKKTDLPMAA